MSARLSLLCALVLLGTPHAQGSVATNILAGLTYSPCPVTLHGKLVFLADIPSSAGNSNAVALYEFDLTGLRLQEIVRVPQRGRLLNGGDGNLFCVLLTHTTNGSSPSSRAFVYSARTATTQSLTLPGAVREAVVIGSHVVFANDTAAGGMGLFDYDAIGGTQRSIRPLHARVDMDQEFSSLHPAPRDRSILRFNYSQSSRLGGDVVWRKRSLNGKPGWMRINPRDGSTTWVPETDREVIAGQSRPEFSSTGLASYALDVSTGQSRLLLEHEREPLAFRSVEGKYIWLAGPGAPLHGHMLVSCTQPYPTAEAQEASAPEPKLLHDFSALKGGTCTLLQLSPCQQYAWVQHARPLLTRLPRGGFAKTYYVIDLRSGEAWLLLRDDVEEKAGRFISEIKWFPALAGEQ